METKVILSKQFTLNLRDFFRGLVMAVLAAVITIIYDSASAGSLDFDWKKIGTTAIIAACAYILKQFTDKNKIITVVGSDASVTDTERQIKRVV